ncbi:MAG: DUF4479 domain-containing protein [Erysipelotrichaceae bacterium]
MNRLFYHNSFPNIWMLVKNDLAVTSINTENDVVILYHNEQVVGYNILNMPKLTNGFNFLTEELVEKINNKISGICDKISIETNKLIIGQVVKLSRINEKASLCDINIGAKIINVVTIADNVKLLDKVVVALPGAVLANGDLVSESIVYGHNSFGVFASKVSILKLNEDVGKVIILSDDAEIGGSKWQKKIS